MEWIFVKFCIGLFILLFSTHKFVQLAEKVSRVFRISPLIVGITVVALGTSLPELAVSLVSIFKGDTGLAMGNIIGSNVINVLMVFPVGLLIGKLRIGKTKTQKNALILLGITLIFFILQYIGIPNVLIGGILIGMSIFVSFVEYEFGVIGRKHEDVKQFKTIKKEKFEKSMIFLVFAFVCGIIGGSVLVVGSVEAISLMTGITTTVLGLTLTAVATSLPELMTTIYSQRDHEEKITVGNIIGSNMYNLLLVGGLVLFFSSNVVISPLEWLWLGGTTVGFVYILKHFSGIKPPRILGAFLLLLFVVYLLTQ